MFWIGLFIGYLLGSLVCLVIEAVCMTLEEDNE